MTQSQLAPDSASLKGKKVLVVGHRRQIIEVLQRLEIPFAVWSNKPIKRGPVCSKLLVQEFPADPAEIDTVLSREFANTGHFTDVIAATEASVVVASVCRRALGARKTGKTGDSIALHCSDKQHMKELMKQHSIPMTDVLFESDIQSPGQVFEMLGPKVVIKQRRNSGGRGVSFATCVADVAARTEPGLLYERFVDAHEMSVETVINNGQTLFTSTTNYLVKGHANMVPAAVPEKILSRVLEINGKVISALNLEWGLTHAEYYWPEDGNPDGVLFGEVALRPPGGYIMDCMSLAYEFDAWEAFVANELNLPYRLPDSHSLTAGVAMFHAGEGTVQSIEGVESIRQMPSCRQLKVLVKPGSTVTKRVGVGEVSAYGLFASINESTATENVLQSFETLRFHMQPVRGC